MSGPNDQTEQPQTADSGLSERSPSGSSTYRLGGRISPVEIDYWPLRDQPLAVLGLLGVVGLLAAAVWQLGQSAWVAVAGVAIVLLSAWRMWLPVRFEVAARGVTRTVLGRRTVLPWTAIRKCLVLRRGVLLVPQDLPLPWAAYSGLYIPWQDRKEELLQLVEYFVRSLPARATGGEQLNGSVTKADSQASQSRR